MKIEVIGVKKGKDLSEIKSYPALALSDFLAVVYLKEPRLFYLMHRPTGIELYRTNFVSIVVQIAFFLQDSELDFLDWESEKGQKLKVKFQRLIDWPKNLQEKIDTLCRWEEEK